MTSRTLLRLKTVAALLSAFLASAQRANAQTQERFTDQYICSAQGGNGEARSGVVLVANGKLLQGVAKTRNGECVELEGVVGDISNIEAHNASGQQSPEDLRPVRDDFRFVKVPVGVHVSNREDGVIYLLSEHSVGWSGYYRLGERSEKIVRDYFAKKEIVAEVYSPPPAVKETEKRNGDLVANKAGDLVPKRLGDSVVPRMGEHIGKDGIVTFSGKIDPKTQKFETFQFRSAKGLSEMVNTKSKSTSSELQSVESFLHKIKRYAACCAQDGKPECDLKFDPESHALLPKILEPAQSNEPPKEELGHAGYSPFSTPDEEQKVQSKSKTSR